MFTRNYYNAMLRQATSKQIPYVTMSGTNSSSFDVNHLQFNSGTYYNRPCMSNLVASYTANLGGVCFGTGRTAPTLDDYSLSGALITTIAASAAVECICDDDGCTLTALYTITNSGSNAITVNEVALVTNTEYQYYYEQSKVMLERTVLDEPLTIPAGGVGQVTYTIRMNYPT